jgi:hypothetical protein
MPMLVPTKEPLMCEKDTSPDFVGEPGGEGRSTKLVRAGGGYRFGEEGMSPGEKNNRREGTTGFHGFPTG